METVVQSKGGERQVAQQMRSLDHCAANGCKEPKLRDAAGQTNGRLLVTGPSRPAYADVTKGLLVHP